MLVSLEEKMSKSILCSQSIWFFSIFDRHISPSFSQQIFAAVEIDRVLRKRYRVNLISASRMSARLIYFCVIDRREEKHKNIMLLVHFCVSFLHFIDRGKRSKDFYTRC